MFLFYIIFLEVCFSSLYVKRNSCLLSLYDIKFLSCDKIDLRMLSDSNINVIYIDFLYNESTDIKICLNKGTVQLSNFITCRVLFYVKNWEKPLIKTLSFGDKFNIKYIERKHFAITISFHGKKLECFICTEKNHH